LSDIGSSPRIFQKGFQQFSTDFFNRKQTKVGILTSSDLCSGSDRAISLETALFLSIFMQNSPPLFPVLGGAFCAA